jgi:hypothetical protein
MFDLVKLEKWAIAYVTAADLGGKPAACVRCTMFLAQQKRCSILGPDIIINSIEKDGKRYSPVCSMQEPGEPMDVPDEMIHYASKLLGPEKADEVGLEWAEGEGTNCGGVNGAGNPCDHFDPKDKTCGPLQTGVQPGDCCAANKNPSMPWREAQKILQQGTPDDYKSRSSIWNQKPWWER